MVETMNNNIDYEKLLAAEERARQEAAAAAEVQAVADRRKQLEEEERLLKELCEAEPREQRFFGEPRQETAEQVELNARRVWLRQYLRCARELYPFPPVVPETLAEEIADKWESAGENIFGDGGKQRALEDLPEQIQKIIQKRWEKSEEERSKRAGEIDEELRAKRDKERKQRESARWAWENGRKKRLLTDKTNTELLAMIELNLREISYWLEHYAFKGRRY